MSEGICCNSLATLDSRVGLAKIFIPEILDFASERPLLEGRPKGTPDPTNSLCWGLFSFRIQEKGAYIKNFEGGGGGLGGPKHS